MYQDVIANLKVLYRRRVIKRLLIDTRANVAPKDSKITLAEIVQVAGGAWRDVKSGVFSRSRMLQTPTVGGEADARDEEPVVNLIWESMAREQLVPSCNDLVAFVTTEDDDVVTEALTDAALRKRPASATVTTPTSRNGYAPRVLCWHRYDRARAAPSAFFVAIEWAIVKTFIAMCAVANRRLLWRSLQSGVKATLFALLFFFCSNVHGSQKMCVTNSCPVPLGFVIKRAVLHSCITGLHSFSDDVGVHTEHCFPQNLM